jgi:hypothetical protein
MYIKQQLTTRQSRAAMKFPVCCVSLGFWPRKFPAARAFLAYYVNIVNGLPQPGQRDFPVFPC